MNGDPGDWVFGPHRITVARHIVRRRGRMSRAEWVAAAQTLTPGAVRQAVAYRRTHCLPWLRPDADRAHRRAAAAEASAEPWRWDAAIRSLPSQRFMTLGVPTVNAVVRAYGAEPLQPFGEPAFLEAMASWGGPTGLANRTAAMRLLCGDLLPDAVLRRHSKASFNRQTFGPRTREFAERWSGRGVDESRVDVERLRAEWLTDRPDGRSLGLLQDAWLADGPPSEGRGG